MVFLQEFLRQSPPTFQGRSNPLDADRWIRRVTKVFDGLGVAEDFKVGLAMYLFDGEADHWWESVKRRRDISALTWGEFDQIFQDKYFPEFVRDRLKADFLLCDRVAQLWLSMRGGLLSYLVMPWSLSLRSPTGLSALNRA